MTISEAVGLVLLSGLGGYGDLCVLDMGEPIRIAEIARNLITMAGRIPGVEIPIVYSGLRPGEKLHEELLTEEEEETAQVRNRINVAKSPPPPPDLAKLLHDLQEVAQSGERETLLRAIEGLVPTYRRTPGQPVVPRAAVLTPIPRAASEAGPGSEKARSQPGLVWSQ
jgi:FlaA1/EpsC-like NDP-sugar epimerase